LHGSSSIDKDPLEAYPGNSRYRLNYAARNLAFSSRILRSASRIQISFGIAGISQDYS
jgi:hypothetical protein